MFKGQQALIFEIRPRKNGNPVCIKCGESCSIYDHLPNERYFEFIPIWEIKVYFKYKMRRCNCNNCGVIIEKIPWAKGKSPLTIHFQIFLANWAKKLSWKAVADSFNTTWDNVFNSVKAIVEYGFQHRKLDNLTAIGIDEIQMGKGHKYITLVYQINQGCKRLLYIAKDRKVKSLLRFFYEIGKTGCDRIQYVCSDMWKPYLKVIAKKIPHALHILDRFHIVAMLNRAIDLIRRDEVKELEANGYVDILKNTKYCFLKNIKNLTNNQALKLNDVLQYRLKSVRAYLLKESFQYFWNYKSPYWANWYLTNWCKRAIRSRLEPIKKFVKSVRKHQPLILNWFKAKKQFSSGVVEGLNRKINLVTRKSYGFRSYEILKIALFHNMGDLPEPELDHKFF
jgi:transposase